ncbi:piggyBac transposable element-derived protein 4-like [Stegodyphus dumicola]|uniref:piggyBac transposable element-derived protein 4-like n=1 Tax=Stegodyphus dumicola TaxID=202533 RepID=UPI0015B23F09|nr:piggyBac transposable element-derived protein 4-like [Stegodyphus dumicola]
MTLIHDLLNKGYSLTLDNFYTSLELSELLIAGKTDICGTLRANRKGLPQELKSERLKKGEIMAFQKGKICVLKWQDKKPISFLSTYHGTDFETLSKNDKLIRKPTAIIDYNKKMGGVDKADQCLAYYPVIRNQQRKYYKKIFRHLLDQAVWNAFVIYTKCGGLNRHLEFRLRLIERLIEEHLTQLFYRTHDTSHPIWA